MSVLHLTQHRYIAALVVLVWGIVSLSGAGVLGQCKNAEAEMSIELVEKDLKEKNGSSHDHSEDWPDGEIASLLGHITSVYQRDAWRYRAGRSVLIDSTLLRPPITT
jgi:hypothetical protein